MVVNPCCMPLKTGVKIVTHVSIALAIAVGGMGVRLISISSEITNSISSLSSIDHLGHNPNNYQQQQKSILKDIMMKSSSTWTESSLLAPPNTEFFSPQRQMQSYHQSQGNFLHPNLTDLEEYANVLLICGLLALCAVFFQFLSSLILLCCVEKEGNAPAQIWTAVNCGVIFCLATCLILFICQDTSSVYSFDEKFFLCLITVDSLLSIYFLWVVMAFI